MSAVFFKKMMGCRAAWWAAFCAILLVGCVPPGGGWSVVELQSVDPSFAEIKGQRLGDMTPYPTLFGDQIELVACRFPDASRILVEGGGPGWVSAWARAGVEAVNRSFREVELLWPSKLMERRSAEVAIQLVSIESPDSRGPRGLGDTRVECDVMREETALGVAVRGTIRSVEIRMRRSRRDQADRLIFASEEEWVGALMHELGHALGFAGHARVGDSLVLLDQSRLRVFGRKALRGGRVATPNLDALYRIRPGQRLGMRRVKAASLQAMNVVESRLKAWRESGVQVVGPIATVGDVQARLRWSRPEGKGMTLVFPRWREELRSGEQLSVVLGADSP